MKKIKQLGWMGLCLMPALALGQQWQALGGRGVTIELDRASVVKVEKGVQAWSRITQPQQVLGPEEGFFYRQQLQLNEYHCENRLYAPLQSMYFSDAGRLVKDQRFPDPDPDELQRVVPGSPEDRLYQNVCRNFNNPNTPQVANNQTRSRPATPPVREKSATHSTSSTASAASSASSPTSPNKGSPALGVPNHPTSNSLVSRSNNGRVQGAKKAPEGTGITGFLSRMLPVKLTSINTASPRVTTPSSQATPGQSTPQPVVEAPKTVAAATSTGENTTPVPTVEGKKPPQATATKSPSRPAPKPASSAPAVNLDSRPTDNLPWVYDPNSPKGPANWAKLSPANALCATGQAQSPIDIRQPVGANMGDISFKYASLPLKVIDTGNTIRVNVDVGSSITWQGTVYDLLYYTFHHPSEIRVNGLAYEMSIHFVHRSAQGKVAIIAVPVKAGKTNPVIQRLWDNLPLEVGVEISPLNRVVNPERLLPEKKNYYAFVGSLSTPPCTEGVLWLVMTEPVELSAQQITDFKRIYQNNVRPVQPLRGRLIKVMRNN